jgi:hypothetical protein
MLNDLLPTFKVIGHHGIRLYPGKITIDQYDPLTFRGQAGQVSLPDFGIDGLDDVSRHSIVFEAFEKLIFLREIPLRITED